MSSLADATFAFADAADAASQSEAAGSSPLTDFSIWIARPKPTPLTAQAWRLAMSKRSVAAHGQSSLCIC